MSSTGNQLKTSIIDHTYRDFSTIAATELLDDTAVKDELFPSKLHLILSTQEYAHIITWKPHGRAFVVLDKLKFAAIVMPGYFDTGNFASFNRSVNGWGFTRLWRKGPDRGAYYHELFLRGRRDLIPAITRLINPGKRLPNPSQEPDLYAISRKYPLPDPLGTPQSKDEEVSILGKRAPSPTLTLQTRRPYRLPNPHGIHQYHGYPGHHPGPQYDPLFPQHLHYAQTQQPLHSAQPPQPLHYAHPLHCLQSAQPLQPLHSAHPLQRLHHAQSHQHLHYAQPPHLQYTQPPPYLRPVPNYAHNSALDHFEYPWPHIPTPSMGSRNVPIHGLYPQGPPSIHTPEWPPSPSRPFCSHPSSGHASLGHSGGCRTARNQSGNATEQKIASIGDAEKLSLDDNSQFTESFTIKSTSMKVGQCNGNNRCTTFAQPSFQMPLQQPQYPQYAPQMQTMQQQYQEYRAPFASEPGYGTRIEHNLLDIGHFCHTQATKNQNEGERNRKKE